MPPPPQSSLRREELLEASYRYAMTHGLSGLSLRPLATAVGSSPRVLLFLFGSKDALVRALLARARTDELELFASLRADAGAARPEGGVLADGVQRVWQWLSDPAHRDLLRLWVEAYARSLTDPDGPWAGFAETSVHDWLMVLADLQPSAARDSADAIAQRTLTLGVLRGALLDLLATGDVDRTTTAVTEHLRQLR